MDDRPELFVAEQACEVGCDISFPNIYDAFNSTSKHWFDNSTQQVWVTDANKPFEAYQIRDKVCFNLSASNSKCLNDTIFSPIFDIERKEPHSPIEDEEFLGYLSLMPKIDLKNGETIGQTLLHQIHQKLIPYLTV